MLQNFTKQGEIIEIFWLVASENLAQKLLEGNISAALSVLFNESGPQEV